MPLRDLIEDLKTLDESAIDSDQAAQAFLSITPSRRMNWVNKALSILVPAYEAGKIYGGEFKTVKEQLDRTVDEAWEEKTRHFWVGRGVSPESAFHGYSDVRNLHTVLSRKKRMDALKPTTVLSKHTGFRVQDVDPVFVEIARDFIDAVYPVAVMVQEMKSKVVKGKKPNPEAIARKAAQLANKDMKTCACCFRSIARLKNGLIADHGYKLPQKWLKTSSCPGNRFRPLEVSDDGLKYMIKVLKNRSSDLAKQLAKAGQLKTLTVQKGWKGEVETLTPSHPAWGQRMKVYKTNIEQEIKHVQASLKKYENEKARWRPVEQG